MHELTEVGVKRLLERLGINRGENGGHTEHDTSVAAPSCSPRSNRFEHRGERRFSRLKSTCQVFPTDEAVPVVHSSPRGAHPNEFLVPVSDAMRGVASLDPC